MNAEIIENEHETVFILKTDLIASNIRELEEAVTSVIDSSDVDIALDLSHIAKIDSMSIAALIRLKNRLIAKGRGFKLLNPNEGITRVLEISGLEKFLLA